MTINVSICKSNYWSRLVALVIFAALSACQPAPKSQQSTIAAPLHKHAQAQRYAVDSLRSTITLGVYRDGPLARFGHNHVVVATQLQGIIYREADMAQSEVELRFPVASMIVDSPDDRAKAGANFPGVLPSEAIAGTREHMLGPQLLAAAQFPEIKLRSVAVQGAWPELQLVIEVNVRTFTSQFVLPVRISEETNTLIAEGVTKLSQVQLGLQPYSVLGGGLRVGDAIDAQFHIVAVKELTAK